MPRKSTRTRILDAAERMFARNGYPNTSLRILTNQAQVNLAAVNYHFGSKEQLLQEVIERRLIPLNRLRQERIEAALAEAEASGRLPQVDQLLRAFIEPTLAFRRSGEGAQDFITLVGRAISDPDETVRNCFMSLVMPIFQMFAASLTRAIPELPQEILQARLHFTIGSLAHIMCLSSNQQANLPGALRWPPEEVLEEQLLRFLQAGLEAPR